MRQPLRDRISDYRNDPYFPTALPLALWFAVRDHLREGWVLFNRYGHPRWFAPCRYGNPLSTMLNRSLFDPAKPIGRRLKLWERLLLALGF